MRAWILLAGALSACLPAREAELEADATSVDAALDFATDALLDAEPDRPLPDASPPRLLGLGEACVASAECATRHCALPCQGYGACAPAECATDADCPGLEGGAHCCVDGACRAVPGECGEREGTQGAACAEGGATDCAAGFSCPEACVSTATCAAECAEDAECRALDATLRCLHLVGGGRNCVPDPDAATACGASSDCALDEACAPAHSFDGAALVLACQPRAGERADGAHCSARVRPLQCRSGYCLEGLCTSACQVDEDCPCDWAAGCIGEMVCRDLVFSVQGLEAPGRACVPGRRCSTDRDCPGRLCSAWRERAGWAQLCGTGLHAGEACDEDEQCGSRLCIEGACRALCADDGDCSGGTSCRALEGLRACLP